MKTSKLRLFCYLVFTAAALGMSYYLGRWQALGMEEASSPQIKTTAAPAARVANNGQPKAAAKTYITVASAKAQLAQIPDGEDAVGQRAANNQRMKILSQLKPGEAAALIGDMPPGSDRDYFLRFLLSDWTRSDAKAALDWVSTLPPDEAIKWGRSIYINYLDGPSAIVAAQYLDKLTDANTRTQAISKLAVEIASSNPQQAIEWLGQVSTGAAYTKAVAAIFNTLASPGQEARAAGGGWTMGGSINQNQNLPLAATLLTSVTDPAVRTGAIAAIADGWGRTDPLAAAAWAVALPDTDSTARTAALNNIVATWAKDDPAAALAFVQKSGDPTQFYPMAPALAQNLAQGDPAAAWAFAQGLPEGATRDQAINNVLTAQAVTDFPSAWTDAQNLPAGASRDAAMDSLVSVEANMNPTKAADLLDELSTGAARQAGIRALAKTWMQQDPQAASVWMDTLPAGPQRNVAVVELIGPESTKDPAAALQWANTITTDTTRANQIQRVITAWAKTDPAAAAQAVQAANMPDDQKATLVQAINHAQAKAK